MPEPLVRRLFDGPIDIVGDIHGEIGAFRDLMRHLAYGDDGSHPAGRRLVFVGDLTDRGPDSPAVVDWVANLIDAGRAQCVLGNHDLNIMLGDRKHDNAWFFGKVHKEDGIVVPQVLADESIRQRSCKLFGELPIALERDDLRVIHACWDNDMIGLARESDDVVALYREYHERIESRLTGSELDEIDRGLEHQNKNPVKVLLSGPEERTEVPTRSAGKIRHERRVRWWNEYRGPFCVFGHYSILEPQPRIGHSAFCVDYGVGKRWTERRAGKTDGFKLKLAALRWPDRIVVFDDGLRQTCQ